MNYALVLGCIYQIWWPFAFLSNMTPIWPSWPLHDLGPQQCITLWLWFFLLNLVVIGYCLANWPLLDPCMTFDPSNASKNLSWIKLHPPKKFEPSAPYRFRGGRTNQPTDNCLLLSLLLLTSWGSFVKIMGYSPVADMTTSKTVFLHFKNCIFYSKNVLSWNKLTNFSNCP